MLGLCWRTLGLRLSIGRRTCGGNEFACQRLSHRFTYSYTHCRCKCTPPFTVTTIHGVSSNVCTCTVPFALQHNISLLHTRLKNGQRRCLRHESTCARSYRCYGPEPGHSRIASFPDGYSDTTFMRFHYVSLTSIVRYCKCKAGAKIVALSSHYIRCNSRDVNRSDVRLGRHEPCTAPRTLLCTLSALLNYHVGVHIM